MSYLVRFRLFFSALFFFSLTGLYTNAYVNVINIATNKHNNNSTRIGISPSNSSIVTPATSNPDNNKNDDPVSNSTPIHNNDPAITFFATSNKKTSTTLTASDNDHNNVTVSTNYTASSSSSSLGKRSRSSVSLKDRHGSFIFSIV